MTVQSVITKQEAIADVLKRRQGAMGSTKEILKMIDAKDALWVDMGRGRSWEVSSKATGKKCGIFYLKDGG